MEIVALGTKKMMQKVVQYTVMSMAIFLTLQMMLVVIAVVD